jgi:O-succinylbenzoic acid--CoA ligase
MPSGRDLWRDEAPRWEGGGRYLLLNPRLSPAWREQVLAAEFPDWSDHVWLATSGTQGTFKVVALAREALAASARAVNRHLGAGKDDVWLNPLPLFHVGGLGIEVRAALTGARVQTCAGWSVESFLDSAENARATLTSLVPTQVHDLVKAGAKAPPSLRAAVVGGGALDGNLRAQARDLGWPILPSYGLTEACSQVATAAPGSTDRDWLPLLPHIEARLAEAGVLELRGPSMLSGWMLFRANGGVRWEDPKADGWFRTGDRAELQGRELRVLGRVDDLVKIRGELVDAAALERELQSRVKSGAVCLIVAEDARNGHTLRVQAENSAAANEAREAFDVFPPFARPQAVEVGPIVRTALGKIVRSVGGG